jgi:hypothetical protein
MTFYPNFVGIGGQKCASTWLSECLRAHPEVFMSSPKEVRFFSDQWEKGLSWYLNFFESAGDFKSRGEFASNYLYNAESAKRIKDTLGDIKVIAVVREPVGRSLSHIKHLIRDGKIPKMSGEISGSQLMEMVQLHPEIISNSMYFAGLQRFIDIFGAESVFIVNQLTCGVNGPLVLDNLWQFLDVKRDVQVEVGDQIVSSGVNPKFFFLEAVRKRLFSFAKYRAPGVINWVKKSGISRFYRVINRGDDLVLSLDATEYLRAQFAVDWDGTQRLETSISCSVSMKVI